MRGMQMQVAQSPETVLLQENPAKLSTIRGKNTKIGCFLTTLVNGAE